MSEQGRKPSVSHSANKTTKRTGTHRLSGLSWMIIMVVLALLLKLSISGLPFSYFTTYFHELGHGLMTVMMGGEIDRIELNLDGSGACYYWAKSHILPAFAGYGFTPIFGALVFFLGLAIRNHGREGANQIKQSVKYWLVVGLLAVMFSVGLMHIRDMMTAIILLGLITVMVAALYWPRYGHLFLKFIGIFMMIDVFAKASYLFSYSDKGDHHALWQLTGIPMIVWILIWFAISGVALFYTAWLLYRVK